MSKLVQGVGINDADYKVQHLLNGKVVFCPFYRAWVNMLARVYSPAEHSRYPGYKKCTLHSEWVQFSCFKTWMEAQDWENKCLDKDILEFGNKHYSPELCCFVDVKTNTFILDAPFKRGRYPLGVHWVSRDNKFQARCRNPFTMKRESLGYFDCPDRAHNSWKQRKHELACQLAEQQSDKRVAEALRTRYL